MSRYVTVLAPLKCANCGYEGELTSFFYRNLGKLDWLEYSLGDTVTWEKFDSVSKGGRPPDGTASVEGWAECPNCGAELIPTVDIVNDTIVKAWIKPRKEA